MKDYNDSSKGEQMRILTVTTPLMHGNIVTRLQGLLQEKKYLEDEVDGIYGVHTGQAVYRAKFWLGYSKPNHNAGQQLIDYLSGDRAPSVGMKLRAAARRRARRAAKRRRRGLTKGQAVLRKACSQLGETENPPDSNRSKFSLWYGLVGPWCAMFCTWCSVDIFKAFKRGSTYAYVPFVRNDAVSGRNGLMVTTAPRSGDFVIYDWNKDRIGDHIGIYADEADLRRFVPRAFDHALKAYGALKSGDFWAVEGNTAIGNESNGGVVMIRKRNRSLVQTFVRAS